MATFSSGHSVHRIAALSLCAVLAASPAAAAGGNSGGGGGGGSSGGSGGGGSGGGGSGGGGASTRSLDLTTCRKGFVWSVRKKTCLKARSGLLPDAELTEYAYALAKAERYQEALATLDSLENPNTPRALNYRGYATRKLGRVDEGIGYYQRSVAMDANYAQVREYLGEAYVIKGRVDLAKEQLGKIEAICGTECEEYEDLAKAITEAGGT